MKKEAVLLLGLILLIYGCTSSGEKTAEDRLAEDNYEDTETDYRVSNDYNSLEENIDILVRNGNLIGARHYDELEASVNDLEASGVDVSELKEKLKQLKVPSRPGETPKGKFPEDIQELDRGENQESEIPEGFRAGIVRRANSELPTEQEKEQLPDCNNKFFSTYPVDMSQVQGITPLGNLGPPGHTFPTDHTYLGVGEYGSGKAFDLFAPADVYITQVSWTKGITDDPIDYTIYFALCKDITGYYNHVKTTSEELNKITDKVECEDFSVQAENSCTKILLEKVDEGTLLGQVGLKQGNFDFGLIDLRKELNFVNPARHPTRTRFIHCVYDYYKEDMQSTFFDLIKRNDENQCGITMQDIPGTLKGTWFHETSPKEYVVDWDVYLAFVNDNEFPDIQVVSIAGFVTDPSKFKFEPKTSGKINREFSQVTVDNNIYCYKASDIGKLNEQIPSGKILVQLTSDTQLKIEHKSGSCSESENFNNPTIYNR